MWNSVTFWVEESEGDSATPTSYASNMRNPQK